ncbi:acyltransferase [Vibrio sp. 10N.261.55.A7]|uniref:acyltransferase family protein n=1 Tax=Vibrio sp. 10N.261.55.A7 TaxID=1880851 RepID=UPI000C81B63D|nr:acyltransferase [Vibrio sp. 10N.261.55.A7]PMJ92847.1 hypothetical protein BCU12_06815 [Vibrio sp. 10N.261.55.A7]
MIYRHDINGLRAIAVIAVIFFHFDPEWIPGGFSGVDVFFVISGFLMTGIIFKGFDSGDFNLLYFYRSRSKRIIPPLAFLCLVILLVGSVLFFDISYQLLVKHALSSLGFFSNFIYWSEAGYFDVSSSEKLFLHTWSLSVEWQFYIIFPLILVILKRFLSIKNLKRSIIAGTILGFIVSVVATIYWPDASYYLLPTRAWEMMAGGVAFIYPWSISKLKRRITEVLGICLITLSFVFVSSDSSWPGYLALLPVIGTYLVIISNQQSSYITNNLFSQYIGRISYSLYLWHWPVAKLIGYLYISSPFLEFFIYISTTLIASTISYLFIELSINRKKLILISLPLLALPFYSAKKDLTIDYNSQQFDMGIEMTYRVDDFSRLQWLEDDRKKVLVIGDSHSTRWASALAVSYPNIAFNVLSYLGCNMTIIESENKIENNVVLKKYEKECEFSEKILNDHQMRESYDLIVLASFQPLSYASNQWRFDLPKVFGDTKWLILGNYYQLEFGASCRNMSIVIPQNCIKQAIYPENSKSYKEEIYYDKFDWKKSEYFNLIEYVCGFDKDRCPYESNGYRMMDDWNHHHMFFIRKLIGISKEHFDRALYETGT